MLVNINKSFLINIKVTHSLLDATSREKQIESNEGRFSPNSWKTTVVQYGIFIVDKQFRNDSINLLLISCSCYSLHHRSFSILVLEFHRCVPSFSLYFFSILRFNLDYRYLIPHFYLRTDSLLLLLLPDLHLLFFI